jgi:hypothetical protein
MKKMQKLFKLTLSLCAALVMLTACQNVKDGLSLKKKNNSDEFLVEKKNPLTTPPDFDELPEPRVLTQSNQNIEKEVNLKTILKKGKTKSVSQTSNSSIEKTILEKIKDN